MGILNREARGATVPGRTNAELDERLRSMESTIADQAATINDLSGRTSRAVAEREEARKPSFDAVVWAKDALCDLASGIVYRVTHQKSVLQLGSFHSSGNYTALPSPRPIHKTAQDATTPKEFECRRSTIAFGDLAKHLAEQAAAEAAADAERNKPVLSDHEVDDALHQAAVALDAQLKELSDASRAFLAVAKVKDQRAGFNAHVLQRAYSHAKTRATTIIGQAAHDNPPPWSGTEDLANLYPAPVLRPKRVAVPVIKTIEPDDDAMTARFYQQPEATKGN